MSLPSFTEFFEALWGYSPFPWQCKTADRAADGDWPAWICVPTGAGKTSTLEVAIYALASQAERPISARTAPCRIVFAVNRRIVVDGAFQHAKTIADLLAKAEPNSPLREVADALRSITGDKNALPLQVFPLRGASYTDRAWTKHPLQPSILTTTLDQLGSRLLFRGYGVSDAATPIHAALLANDALLILDEAHTSHAFSSTLESITRFRATAPESIPVPFASVQLTATPPPSASAPVQLDDEDRKHPVLSLRLGASKPAELLAPEPGITGKNRPTKIAQAIVVAYRGQQELRDEDSPNRTLIVANSVRVAEIVATTLQEGKRKQDRAPRGITVELLTGRLRPMDRDALIERIVTNHDLQKTPSAKTPGLVLVATQCVEVGADFDFDSLVTELAPLDALRQRFGRLNRTGRQIAASATIVSPADTVELANSGSGPKKEDPIYGSGSFWTYKWLIESATPNQTLFDFGLDAIATVLRTRPIDDRHLSPSAPFPVVLPAHLDLLCQTSPRPHVEPEPSLYIHGSRPNLPEVAVAVRRELPTATAQVQALLDDLPPLAAECANLPLYLVKNWLEAPDGTTDMADFPGADLAQRLQGNTSPVSNAFIWRGGQATEVHKAVDLRGGDTLILPASLDYLGSLLANLPEQPADRDHYEKAFLASRDKFCLVLDSLARTHLRNLLPESEWAVWDTCFPSGESVQDDTEVADHASPDLATIARLLQTTAAEELSDVWKYALDYGLGDPSLWSVRQHPNDSGGWILVARRRSGISNWPLDPDEAGRQGPHAQQEIELDDHQQGVERRLQTVLERLPVPEPISDALLLAARYHDIGKLDPRFQAMLQGTIPELTTIRPPLAKSAGWSSFGDSRARAQTARVPKGFRHELVSCAALLESAVIDDHAERDLLLHLVASHHGRCRCFPPVVPDSRPENFEFSFDTNTFIHQGNDAPLAHLENGSCERFWALQHRFGWWGLAYLESLLRLADQAESAEPTHTT